VNLANSATQNAAHVLAKAALKGGHVLGLSQTEVGKIIGRDRSTMQRSGVDPETPNGELALLLVRCYRSLYALMDGDTELMRHWMHGHNHHTGGVPAQQIRSVLGLVRVCEYLDSIRGKA
jgi:hypothetical protein